MASIMVKEKSLLTLFLCNASLRMDIRHSFFDFLVRSIPYTVTIFLWDAKESWDYLHCVVLVLVGNFKVNDFT